MVLRLCDRHLTTVVKPDGRWRWWLYSPLRHNPVPLDAACLTATLATQQGSRVKATVSLAVTLRRPDTGTTTVHVSFVSGRREGRWCCLDRRDGQWHFKAGRWRRVVTAPLLEATLGTPMTCKAPCDHPVVATRRRFTMARCIDECNNVAPPASSLWMDDMWVMPTRYILNV